MVCSAVVIYFKDTKRKGKMRPGVDTMSYMPRRILDLTCFSSLGLKVYYNKFVIIIECTQKHFLKPVGLVQVAI